MRRLRVGVPGVALLPTAGGAVAAKDRPSAPRVAGLTVSAPTGPAAWLVELEEPGAAVAWAEVLEATGPTQAPTHGAVARARAAAGSRLLSIAAAQDALATPLTRLGGPEISGFVGR